MHTRSITKRLMELENGMHAFTSLSDTGEGIHTQFEYGYRSKPLDLSTGGSLSSSFSSESSSDQSINSIFDGSLSSFSSSSSSMPAFSVWDSYHVASSNISNSSRPVQRTSPQRWVRDPETGELCILESNSWPFVQAASSGRSVGANEDEIFERELETAMQNRVYMADLTKKLIALDQLNEDQPPVEEDPEVPSEPKAKPLGPEGTELIDETFRAPPGELGVYPERWVTHQSTLLRPQPTEPNISQ